MSSGTFGLSVDLRAHPVGLRRSDSTARPTLPPKHRAGLHFWIEAAPDDGPRPRPESMRGTDTLDATIPSRRFFPRTAALTVAAGLPAQLDFATLEKKTLLSVTFSSGLQGQV